MGEESCGICAGDGRIANAFGSSATCPACHGSGRRAEAGGLLRDVTKTKPSHHQPARTAKSAQGPEGPSTYLGIQLATEVQTSGRVSNETKAKLVREIVEYEGSHGSCTQTFIKKIRKQVKPAS
jgi:DnaJ-class molecular chaperone